jgi:hypothetical protein
LREDGPAGYSLAVGRVGGEDNVTLERGFEGVELGGFVENHGVSVCWCVCVRRLDARLALCN